MRKNSNPIFLNLFAGAGGLSEGFIRAGFSPAAHIELDAAACFTLRTRMAYHWLKTHQQEEIYKRYLSNKINRTEFYKHVPSEIIHSVINEEICNDTLPALMNRIDEHLGKRKIDLIIGGPPCQAYSVAGRARDKNKMKGDKRNYHYKYYAEFLKKYNPSLFVFENVKGLLSAKDKNGELYFSSMRELFLKLGYKTEYKLLSAEQYGVLQNRKRIILIGKRGKGNGYYPEPDNWNPDILINEIFSDLPCLSAGQGNAEPFKLNPYSGKWLYKAGIRNDDFPVTWHQSRPNTEKDLEIYRIAVSLWNKKKTRLQYNDLPEHLKFHKHRDSFADRFKVVASDLPYSHTVVAHIAKDGHYYIHPDIKQNRSITPREAARLQTFPDDYFFESVSGRYARTPVFRQIGNAVPVLLARKIAEKIKEECF